MMEILDTTIYGLALRRWAYLIGVTLGLFLFLRLLQLVLVRKLESISKRTSTIWDDILAAAFQATRPFFLLAAALYISAAFILPTDQARLITGKFLTVALLAQGGLWLNAAIKAWIKTYRQRQLSRDAAAATTVGAVSFVVRLVMWAVILLLALDNLGVDVTTLVAGLGVGGIAVALAVQNILGDVFASLSIVLDKPFVLGDFVIVGDFLGTVENVGLKTTRLRSLSGEQLIFANSDLLKSRVRNYGRMFERRVVFTVGVTYQTAREKLQSIPVTIRKIVEAQDKTRFDRSHFKAYGDFSLVFETVYYVLAPDYNIYMDIQQAINFGIHEAFEREGIDFAYPTQTLFLNRQETTESDASNSGES